MWKQKTAESLNTVTEHDLSLTEHDLSLTEHDLSLTEHDLQNCFEHCQHRMQLCVNSEGNYFEGDYSWFPEFVK
jgi:hypothetical protein